MSENRLDEPVLHKVAAFITRAREGRVELLMFKHPHDEGIQFPAGTVEEGEEFDKAALREAREESGLSNLWVVAHIGTLDETIPPNMIAIVRTTRVYARPDVTRFNWAQLRNGIGVERLREQAGFTQVDWCEYDRHPHGTYIPYRITGWVPNHAIARKQQRHFYHLTANGDTEETWKVFIDNHTYRLFWLSLASIAEKDFGQKVWFDWVVSQSGYTFQ